MKSENKNCDFCEVSIEKAVFASSDNFYAIYNIAPILPGHSMIIPKFHFDSLMKLDDDLLKEMMSFSKNVITILRTTFNAHDFDLTIQDGKNAGQTIPHLHMHIIPRKANDLPDVGDWYPILEQSKNSKTIDSESRKKLSESELELIINRLKKI